MDLNVLWFGLVAVLFVGFFFLEGFDYGVGALLPFLGRSDRERRVIVGSIGPFWDGNEVWLLTAGGATFAAFPHWYATLFSGFYLALVLMLLALIVRGVAFEFRGKFEGRWRGLWDWGIFLGSALPSLLWGVAIANLMRGVPIDARMSYAGDFLTLLSPYALLGGAAFLLLFALHGAIFLNLRTADVVAKRAHGAATRLWLPTVGAVALFVGASFLTTDIFSRSLPPALVVLLAALALLAAGPLVRAGRQGWAFAATGLTIALATVAIFAGLFPRLMISTLDPAWSLTIYNASSSPYTLGVMSIVALTCLPFVLAYQGWTYWVFRKRVGESRSVEY